MDGPVGSAGPLRANPRVVGFGFQSFESISAMLFNNHNMLLSNCKKIGFFRGGRPGTRKGPGTPPVGGSARALQPFGGD